VLPSLVEDAARRGARRLWVHSTADLREAGFAPRQGYRRFTADACPPGEPLPVLDIATVLELLPRMFIGQWGHKLFDPAWAASAEAIYVGLSRQASWVGLCRVERDRRLIDGPGFIDGSRTDAAVRRLVLGACAQLSEGPVTVDTWGEPAEPYLASGFEMAEEDGGWERVLHS
jgi:hypothetical protein